MNKLRTLWCLTAILATGTFFFTESGITLVSATNTPQSLPFSQNWSTTTLITANDDWSGVPGIVGYLGDIAATTTTNVDPRTLLLDYSSVSAVDVIANQTNPDTLTNGGVAEFDGIANPSIALNGSGTADAPHIVIHLNTTGQSNIRFQANIRDLDGSADDSVQQIDVQYRVGGTGDYASVSGGYIADATAAGTATLVTPIDVTLPAAANNQSLVQIRVMTTNAGGNDEWVGIDDISVTAGPGGGPQQHVVDYDGDGKTDYSVVRNTGGGAGGQVSWFNNLSSTGTSTVTEWGISTDFFVPADYDGDNKTDIAVWRPAPATVAAFYILQSQGNTIRIETFGQSGDDPSVVDDYDGDGKADLAVYRDGAASGDQSFWFYRGSLNNPSGNVSYVPWGSSGDFPSPGDYDGDNKADFVVQRSFGAQGRFWMLQTSAGFDSVVFGLANDLIVPGDYDADEKTDLAVARPEGGVYNWYVRPSSTGTISASPAARFGLSTSDFITQGDYDGDGKTDFAVWRSSASVGGSAFWVLGSTGGLMVKPFGSQGDYPVANYNVH